MKKTAIVYGSSTDNTASVAKAIGKSIAGSELFDISAGVPGSILDFEVLILGSSTWGVGELQDDWQDHISDLAGKNLSGKLIAFFGTGDQEGYPDTFCDALGILKEELESSGATFIGQIANEGYGFDESRAQEGEILIGLLLDEDNESEKTEGRIERWLESMSALLG